MAGLPMPWLGHNTQACQLPSFKQAQEHTATPRAAQRATEENKRAMVDKVSAFIFDCDGAHSAAQRLKKASSRAHPLSAMLLQSSLLLELCPGLFTDGTGWPDGVVLFSVQASSGAGTP